MPNDRGLEITNPNYELPSFEGETNIPIIDAANKLKNELDSANQKAILMIH